MAERLKIPLMLSPALIAIIVLFTGGLFLGLLQSFNYMPLIGKTTFNLEAYRNIVTSVAFHSSFLLTFHVAFTATTLSTIGAVICALVLRENFYGKRLLTFVFQLNLPIPHVVGAIGILMLVSPSGLLGRVAAQSGLIETQADFPILVFDKYGIGIILEYLWKEIPFIGVIVLAVMQAIGTDYEEIAQSLGANRWQRFRYVLLPLIMPGVLRASIFVFAFAFGAVEIPLLLGQTFPSVMSVLAFRSYANPDLDARGEAMAMSMIITAMVALLIYLYMKLTRTYLRQE